MQNLPVHWYEGLFLRPHHLQANDRYWAELTSTSDHWDNAYNYGIYDFEYSREALSNYFLDISVLKARMQDGTLVDLEHGRKPDRLALKEAFANETMLRVYLGVPKLKLGRENCGAAGDLGDPRYAA